MSPLFGAPRHGGVHRRRQIGFLLQPGSRRGMDLRRRVVQPRPGFEGVVLVGLVVVDRVVVGGFVVLRYQRGVIGHVDAEFQLLLWFLRALHQRREGRPDPGEDHPQGFADHEEDTQEGDDEKHGNRDPRRAQVGYETAGQETEHPAGALQLGHLVRAGQPAGEVDEPEPAHGEQEPAQPRAGRPVHVPGVPQDSPCAVEQDRRHQRGGHSEQGRGDGPYGLPHGSRQHEPGP